jgi:chaperonin GroES
MEEGHMKVRPLHDRILVKRIEEEAKSKGGIIIPDTAKEKPQEGKVVAVGKGKVNEDGKLRPLDVHKGDRILFGKYSGTEIQLEGEEHLIIREDDGGRRPRRARIRSPLQCLRRRFASITTLGSACSRASRRWRTRCA